MVGKKSLKKNIICKILSKYSKVILNLIEHHRKLCIKYKALDEAFYLNYQDALNLFSLDPDRT